MACYSKAGLVLFLVMITLVLNGTHGYRGKRATDAVPHSLQEDMDAQISRTDILGNNTQQMISVLGLQTQQLASMLNRSTQMVSILETQSEQFKNLTSVIESMAALLAHSFPILTKGLRLTAGDCLDIAAQGPYSSGVYTITPWDDLGNKGSFKVYCDMNPEDGGWTVLQRRINGSVDFYRDWNEYKNGFGDPNGEFWLGLDKLNRLTSTRGVSWTLKVELEDFEGNTSYALYDDFRIGNESTQFQLSIGTYSGTAGDSLDYHNGAKFSTKDRDNDTGSDNCAQDRGGAWWYKSCAYSNLNGPYLESAERTWKSVNWYHWKNAENALKHAQMKMRPTTL